MRLGSGSGSRRSKTSLSLSFDPKTVSENGELVFVTDKLGSFYSNPDIVSKMEISLGEITLRKCLKQTLYASSLSRAEGLKRLQQSLICDVLTTLCAYPPAERIFKNYETIAFSQPMCITYTNQSSTALSVTLDLDVDCSQILNSCVKYVSDQSLSTNPVLILPTWCVKERITRGNATLPSSQQRILAFNNYLTSFSGTVYTLTPKTEEGYSLSEFLTKPLVEGFLYEVESSLLTDGRFVCTKVVGKNFPVSGLNETTSRFRMKVMSPSLDLVSESEAQGAHVTSLDEDAVLWMPSLLVVQGSSGMNLTQQSSTGPFLP